MKRALVWFKTDLRIEDNETLVRAVQENDEIIPVYVIDRSYRDKTAFGFQKTGNFRMNFILESLHDLKSQLQAKGSNLIVTVGLPEEKIPDLAKQFGVDRVYAKKEVAFEEKRTEQKVEKELWKFKCTLETCSTSTLYYATDLPFGLKDIPDVFTTFRKKIERETEIRPIFQAPNAIKSPKLPDSPLPTLTQLGFEAIKKHPKSAFPFSGGESQAWRRLNNYFFEQQQILTYKETRNGLVGTDFSTKFSPWLAQGCISPRSIYHQVKKFESEMEANESTYWVIFELIWRDYFRFSFKKHHNKFFQQAGIKGDEHPLNSHNELKFNRWKNGETGQNFVNANMRELKATGFMSNRGRQNVASYLCHDLQLDWRYGAAYFEEILIDYDVCSNWGNWAYLAGVGNDPRGVRAFNVEKQAKDYDKDGAYQKLWLSDSF